jgi:hypothetical protein
MRGTRSETSNHLTRLVAPLCVAVAWSGADAIAQEAEPHNAGLVLGFDNDLFAMNDDDFDYTGGGVVTFAGRRAVESRLSLDRVLEPLDRLVPYARGDRAGSAQVHHALQFALIAFTPDALNVSEPIYDDRPYASFVGLANVRTFVANDASAVYETSFAVGVLGLDIAKSIQRRIHEALDLNEIPEGWDYQIADGGEPTFRFGWARQALLEHASGVGARAHDVKWRVETNVGYITEASLALSARWGRIHTPWWSLSPDRNAYLSQASPIVGSGSRPGAREL